MKKIVRRGVTALLIVASLLTAVIVGAEMSVPRLRLMTALGVMS